MLSARRVVPVSWQRSQASPEGSTVRIITCSMAKELEKPGVDNVGEWWLVSTLGTGTLFRRSNEGPMFRRSAILKVCYCDCDLICMARAANL